MTPIFVIGRHRSGTTWVANVLAGYHGVYALRHESHRGVHESAFFSHLVPHCRGGRTQEDLLCIKHLFERSDFFLLTGLTEGPDILRNGPAGYFRKVMDAAAQARGAHFWLEKTPAHTLHARFIVRSFPDAFILAIVRRASDVVASNVHGFGDPRSLRAWFRQSLVTGIYEKVARGNASLVVRYEDLCDDFRGTMRIIESRLGLGKGSHLHDEGLGRNSSYSGVAPQLQWWQSAAIGAGQLLVSLVPAPLLQVAIEFWRKRKRSATLPDWFFLVSRNRHVSSDHRPGTGTE